MGVCMSLLERDTLCHANFSQLFFTLVVLLIRVKGESQTRNNKIGLQWRIFVFDSTVYIPRYCMAIILYVHVHRTLLYFHLSVFT
jgi:hypothetical protein